MSRNVPQPQRKITTRPGSYILLKSRVNSCVDYKFRPLKSVKNVKFCFSNEPNNMLGSLLEHKTVLQIDFKGFSCG